MEWDAEFADALLFGSRSALVGDDQMEVDERGEGVEPFSGELGVIDEQDAAGGVGHHGAFDLNGFLGLVVAAACGDGGGGRQQQIGAERGDGFRGVQAEEGVVGRQVGPAEGDEVDAGFAGQQLDRRQECVMTVTGVARPTPSRSVSELSVMSTLYRAKIRVHGL